MREKSKRESKTMRLLRNKNLTKKRAWIDGWLRGGESSMDQNNLLLIKTLLLHNVVSPICLFTCVESCPPWWHLMLLMVTFFKSFLMWTIFKVFMESITILLLFFGFWSFSTRHVRSQHPLPRPGIEARSPSLWADSLPADLQGKSKNTGVGSLSLTPVDLPDPGIQLGSPALQVDSLPTELSGKPVVKSWVSLFPIQPFAKS